MPCSCSNKKSCEHDQPIENFEENYDTSSPEEAAIFGVTAGVFIALVVIQILFLLFMIWFSIHVVSKCGGKPAWLTPTVVTLLILWLCIGWFPGVGFCLFLILIIILISFQISCGQRQGGKRQLK